MNWGLQERPAIRPPARLKFDALRKQELLLLPERVVQLNETAGAILRLCDGQRTVGELTRELEAKYGQTGLQDDIAEFLTQAAEEGWVERCS